ncbi:methyltransferase family protein [Planctomicrobium sp. SH661]|uniref:methyltransferase family protein n=1 Tax=Planctomicrobium sp. SH661 TaxID=3448124 RepID=UPI003F5CB834
MALREHFESSGNWLFQRRSFLPFLLFLLLIPALPEIHRPWGSAHLQRVWELIAFAVSLSGLMIRCLVGGLVPAKTSGRNTAGQVAETLNTTGVYSVVRHPLYLGNFLMWLGISLFCFVPWMTVTFVLCFWLYYERIMFAEEEYLRSRFGAAFETWAEKTPAFIPRISQWKSSNLPFSFRTMLRKEYTGLFGIAVAFLCMDQFEQWIMTRQFSSEPHWPVIGLLSLILYTVLMFLKKKTTLLKVAGR